ncbi:hypothetical protein U91I_01593 [alpha proteobacterium U9-1i]|nr:hypothetical protein U91I_01593 [alpha proteobacterium U9-1i]
MECDDFIWLGGLDKGKNPTVCVCFRKCDWPFSGVQYKP